jgi:hypothetical protein
MIIQSFRECTLSCVWSRAPKLGCSFSSRLVGLSQVVADIYVNGDCDDGRT